jgi:hypothetical protein
VSFGRQFHHRIGKIMGAIPFKPPRGIRANNPGNIRKAATEWLGEIDGVDPDFETFDTPEHGIRALAKIVLTYSRKYHLKTVGGIISRWAPPNENDTLSYVKHISRGLGVEPDQPLDLESDPRGRLQLEALVTLIIRHENGRNPEGKDWYPQHEPDGSPGPIARGVGMALEG